MVQYVYDVEVGETIPYFDKPEDIGWYTESAEYREGGRVAIDETLIPTPPQINDSYAIASYTHASPGLWAAFIAAIIVSAPFIVKIAVIVVATLIISWATYNFFIAPLMVRPVTTITSTDGQAVIATDGEAVVIDKETGKVIATQHVKEWWEDLIYWGIITAVAIGGVIFAVKVIPPLLRKKEGKIK